ncbi:hypothetical protein BGAL_0663g00030 [Botrytis galanthina]|uniref:Uncharacterized protein n=1 Tax=Botrytis galanthina TaxID=278940 RepID=A0A4S8QSB4_9HELO|nr:hypothetical protein BGAL_0663g00030 [Botrytis galanthina]
MIKVGRTEQDFVRLRGDENVNYPDKVLVRNNAKYPTVQKAPLARFRNKPNTSTTIGAQPEEKPPNTPSKSTPENPVKDESSKTAANNKLFSSLLNGDKDPKELTESLAKDIQQHDNAVTPTKELKVDLDTTKSKKMSDLMTRN